MIMQKYNMRIRPSWFGPLLFITFKVTFKMILVMDVLVTLFKFILGFCVKDLSSDVQLVPQLC